MEPIRCSAGKPERAASWVRQSTHIALPAKEQAMCSCQQMLQAVQLKAGILLSQTLIQDGLITAKS